ncbi:MAG: type II toxin-antitoxin system Phd/YefM family antitoxin [bacterium]
MKATWALQDAKSRFSEVVEDALHKGPQWVTRRGVDAVVIVSARDFRKASTGGGSLVRFFRESPLCGADLDLTRVKDAPRKVDL